MKYGRKLSVSLGLLIATAAGTTQASSVTYAVSSTSKVNCSNSPHGLWANQYQVGGGGCQQYYDFQKGSTLVVDESTGTALLKATGKNPAGVVGTVDLYRRG